MKLSIEHIDPNNGDLPCKKISLLETVEKLDHALLSLLWDELSAGNFIWEAGRDFPNQGSLYVSLSHPFQKSHKTPPGVTYIEEVDCHYNTARYITEGPIPHALCAPYRK